MTATGDGEPHLQECHEPSLLELADVDLEEFLHCFSDPLPLDYSDGNSFTPIRSPKNVSHSSSRHMPPVGSNGSPLDQLSESRGGNERNENALPSDKPNVSRIWPLSPRMDTMQQLVDSQNRPASIQLEASLNGLFFEAERPGVSPNTTLDLSSSIELTCYRRNMFKVNAAVSLPPYVGHLAILEGQQAATIVGLHAQLRATESIKRQTAELIKAEPKTSQSVHTGEAQPLPITISLDQLRSSQPGPLITMSWERIQFRKSTLKSPRPTGLMQTYQVCVEVVGTLSDGRIVPLTRSESNSIIVRGRSPKSYQPNKKEVDIEPCLVDLSKDLSPERPSILPLEAPDVDGVSQAQDIREGLGIDEDTRLASNDSLLRENVEDSHQPPKNYTYIPMPVMDWSPPVEAFFRPHRVHHRKATEFSARSTTKRRYYMPDDVTS